MLHISVNGKEGALLSEVVTFGHAEHTEESQQLCRDGRLREVQGKHAGTAGTGRRPVTPCRDPPAPGETPSTTVCVAVLKERGAAASALPAPPPHCESPAPAPARAAQAEDWGLAPGLTRTQWHPTSGSQSDSTASARVRRTKRTKRTVVLTKC